MQYSWTKPNKTCFMLKFSLLGILKQNSMTMNIEYFDMNIFGFFGGVFWIAYSTQDF